MYQYHVIIRRATVAGKTLAIYFGAIVALFNLRSKVLKSVKGVTTVGARDQVVKPVLQYVSAIRTDDWHRNLNLSV